MSTDAVSRRSYMRELIAQGVIVCAALVGASMLFVAPLRERMASEQATLDSTLDEMRRAGEVERAAAVADDLIRRAAQRAERINALSARSGDPITLYEMIFALAEDASVSVDQVQPRRTTAGRGSQDSSPSAAFAITAIGGYEDIATFLASIEREAGFSVVESISLRPMSMDGRQLMHATIETTHYHFEPGLAKDNGERAMGESQ